MLIKCPRCCLLPYLACHIPYAAFHHSKTQKIVTMRLRTVTFYSVQLAATVCKVGSAYNTLYTHFMDWPGLCTQAAQAQGLLATVPCWQCAQSGWHLLSVRFYAQNDPWRSTVHRKGAKTCNAVTKCGLNQKLDFSNVWVHLTGTSRSIEFRIKRADLYMRDRSVILRTVWINLIF